MEQQQDHWKLIAESLSEESGYTPPNELVYLACPYSGSPELMKARVEACRKRTHDMTRRGIAVFSPLLYTDGQAAEGVEPPQGWYVFDLVFLSRCDRMEVLKLPGWRESQGVTLELATAYAMKMPVKFISPVQIGLKPGELRALYD